MVYFEDDLIELFGKRISEDDSFARRIYAATTNIIWRKGELEFAATFRYAGGMIADIQDKGGYMDWYCSAGEGVVDDNIASALLTKGWTPHEYEL